MRRKRCMDLSLHLNWYSLEFPLNKIYMFLAFHFCFPRFEMVYAMNFFGFPPSLRPWEWLTFYSLWRPKTPPYGNSLLWHKKALTPPPLPIPVCPPLSVSFCFCPMSGLMEVRRAKLIYLVIQHPETQDPLLWVLRSVKNTRFRNHIGLIHLPAPPSTIRLSGSYLCSNNFCTANPQNQWSPAWHRHPGPRQGSHTFTPRIKWPSPGVGGGGCRVGGGGDPPFLLQMWGVTSGLLRAP